MKLANRYFLLICIFMALAGTASYFFLYEEAIDIESYTDVSRSAHIRPDYNGIVIPPNITALNFVIEEHGTRYFVRIRSARGQNIEISSRSSRIIIPLKKWRQLLKANKGNRVFFDVYVRGTEHRWRKYQTIVNTIANHDIDAYIVYRLMKPIYNLWRNIGIYQRNLEDYDESVVLHGESFGHSCLNCHTFLNNSPESMFIGIRSRTYGSSAILSRDGDVHKIGTKFGYTSWHPSGKLAVYSLNKVRQFFHSAKVEVRDVLDIDSALAYYVVDTRAVKTTPAISDKDRLETYPTWGPDGRYLYFCSAPMLWTDRNKIPLEYYDKIKYDLTRISYDLKADEWGRLQTVLSSERTGLSVILPRVSPDGRFLLFCMCEYGCFPIYQQSSDLYMMNLETGEYRKLEINSDQSESWHSWSSNSRWIVFSSKRRGGLFTRTYISYVDETGKAYKPFILPQKDPAFYDSFLKTYSVPELITSAVDVSQKELSQAVRSPTKIMVELPITAATPMPDGSEPWQQERE